MNLHYFTEASLAIQIHILVAMGALFLGIFMFVRKKGTRSHKMIGRVFAVLMLATACSAMFAKAI